MDYGYITHYTNGTQSITWGFDTKEQAMDDTEATKTMIGADFDYAEIVKDAHEVIY